jgi:uncharacterized protein YbjT (DUF2867 family)
MGRVGGGLRSSLSGITATVFGARGFLGTFTASELGKVGTTMVLPHHGCEMEMRHCKVMGDYGQIAIVPFNARDKDSIRSAVEGSDIVINLIGKHHITRHGLPHIINWTLDECHVEAATNIAEISKEMGVERFVHVSSIAADPDSNSEFAASKARGEAAVKAIYPNAAVVRPSFMFGPEDRYLCLYANAATVLPALPLINEGSALAEPVYVHDVAKAIKNIVLDPSTDGQTYELVGPEQYTQKQIVEYVLDQTGSSGSATGDGHHRGVVSLPEEAAPILEMLGTAVEYAAGAFSPPVTGDMTKLMAIDHIASGDHPGLTDLMVEPTALETVGQDILYRFRPGGHFNDREGYHDFVSEKRIY